MNNQLTTTTAHQNALELGLSVGKTQKLLDDATPYFDNWGIFHKNHPDHIPEFDRYLTALRFDIQRCLNELNVDEWAVREILSLVERLNNEWQWLSTLTTNEIHRAVPTQAHRVLCMLEDGLVRTFTQCENHHIKLWFQLGVQLPQATIVTLVDGDLEWRGDHSPDFGRKCSVVGFPFELLRNHVNQVVNSSQLDSNFEHDVAWAASSRFLQRFFEGIEASNIRNGSQSTETQLPTSDVTDDTPDQPKERAFGLVMDPDRRMVARIGYDGESEVTSDLKWALLEIISSRSDRWFPNANFDKAWEDYGTYGKSPTDDARDGRFSEINREILSNFKLRVRAKDRMRKLVEN